MTGNRFAVLTALAATGFLLFAAVTPSQAGTVVRDHRSHSGFSHGGCRPNCAGTSPGGVVVTQTGTRNIVPTKLGGSTGSFGGIVHDHR